MYKILLATHGNMCKGMLDTLSIFSDDVSQVSAIPFYTDELDGDAALKEYMDQVTPEDTLVILTDLPGGSVNQKVFGRISDKIHVISGVNLPLLYSLALADEEQVTKDFIREKIVESRQVLQYMNDLEVVSGEGDE